MDERDFAELISVFLKGDTPEKNSTGKTKEKPVNAAEVDADEVEVRKNIIEALAERIKESQETENEIAEESDDSAKEALSAQNSSAYTPSNQEEIAEQEVEEETASFDNSSGEIPGFDVSPEEQLVTKEEVDQLLSKEEPPEIATLQQILHRFTAIDGVIAALLVTRDGFIVDYASNIEFELDMISAVIATGFGALDKIGYELEQGPLQLAMIEYEQGPIVVAPLVQDIALVVVASQWATLGRIRWEIKKQSDELVANL